MRPLQSAAGEELNFAAFVDVRLDAVAIQLQLMDPVRSHRRRRGFRRQLGSDKRRQSFLFSRKLCRGKGDSRLFLVWAGSLWPIRLPYMIPVVGNGPDVTFGEGAVSLLVDDWLVLGGLFVLVIFLDQEPIRLSLFSRFSAHADKHPFALQFLAVKDELEIAFGQSLVRVAQRFPGTFIPQHHRAAAILTLGNGAFEAAVFHRVIFDLDRQPFIAGHVAWPLGYRPTFEHAVQPEAKVVMQTGGGMLLNDERQRPGLSQRLATILPTWFGCLAEVAHLAIALQL